jgi:hypothetical protein
MEISTQKESEHKHLDEKVSASQDKFDEIFSGSFIPDRIRSREATLPVLPRRISDGNAGEIRLESAAIQETQGVDEVASRQRKAEQRVAVAYEPRATAEYSPAQTYEAADTARREAESIAPKGRELERREILRMLRTQQEERRGREIAETFFFAEPSLGVGARRRRQELRQEAERSELRYEYETKLPFIKKEKQYIP